LPGQRATFCRICEPLCGMLATVEDGGLVSLRPDRDHPLSSGFAYPEGIAFAEVQNGPDRVTTPLRRTLHVNETTPHCDYVLPATTATSWPASSRSRTAGGTAAPGDGNWRTKPAA
jgi:anaerobic selenocysteine-containing dehydrogenase